MTEKTMIVETDYGLVAEEVVGAITQMQHRVNSLTLELGRMEVRKSGMISEIHHLEGLAQNFLSQEAKKLGIPEGTTWQLTPDGRAVVISREG